MSIRTLIADDQQLVRTGFALILQPHPDIEVVGQATDGHEAIALARELDPHDILKDISMTGLDGLEAHRRLLADTSTTRCTPAPAAFCSRTPRPNSSSPPSAPWPPATRCSPPPSPAA